MKKVILSFAVLAMAMSCCKKPATEAATGASTSEETVEQQATEGAATVGTPVEIDVKGTKLEVPQGSLEQQIVEFLTSGDYEKATEEELKTKWYDLGGISFEMGSSSSLKEGSDVQLKNLVAILKAYPEAKIKIGGYTDKTGNEDSNKKISQARAEFIKAELEKAGVGAQVVSAEGYGSEFAKVAADASDEERAADRKMSIRFTK